MLRFIFVLCFVFLDYGLCEKPLGPLVLTKSGKIRGHYLTSFKGNQYEAYQGIPFAEPPVGERRFQSPKAVEKWTNELQATKLRDICLSENIFSSGKPTTGSEDCLYLDIYVPTNRQTKTNLPVVFFIHGGAFRVGSRSDEQESYIIDYDVIFVSIDYRTGSLGFLSTEDDVVSGNMGLKDQAMALKWVYDNIESFGGDRKRITLVGQSAGAMSVHHHYLSAWSSGLFHAGISLSGTSYNPTAVMENSRNTAIALGRAVNCTDDNIRQMIECLRKVPADALVAAQSNLQVWQSLPMVFGPVVEKSSDDPFIDDYPSEILRKGKAYDVPWIAGVVSHEGLVQTAGYLSNDTLKYLNNNWNTLAPMMLEYTYTIPKEQHASVSQKIREHYLEGKPINRDNFDALTQLVGDRVFGAGAVNAAKAQATVNKSPVFFYHYTYRAVDSFTNSMTNSTENLGTAHCDDLFLVLKTPMISPTKSPNDMAMQRRLIQLWTSVAYNGVPDIGVEWPRVTPKNTTITLDYMLLGGPNNLKPLKNDNFAHRQFWDSIGFDEK